MVTFDLKTTNKVTIKKAEEDTFHFELFFVEDKLHKICSENGDHCIYDKTKQFQKITTFEDFTDLYNYHSIHLKLKQSISILLFGEHVSAFLSNQATDSCQNSIYSFSCTDLKWKELNIKIPIKVSDFGLVATKNEQYIIILGGRMRHRKYSDDIFIYDIRNNIFTKSKMKCP
eukprot:256430_1